MTDLDALSDLCTPWCVRVVATLRVADHIAAGVTEVTAIAAAANCDARALTRVLNHLAGKGLFRQPAPGRFELTAAAEGLLDGAGSGLSQRLGLDLDAFGGRMAHAWGSLLTAVRTGKPAYEGVFGLPFWADLAAKPDIAAAFDELMAAEYVPDPAVLGAPVHTVVDVGGGTGTFLAEILRAWPKARGILVDLPRVVSTSDSVFDAAGVAERVTVAGQSFFDPLPAGADLYVLRSVLADWPDPEAEAILARCAEAAGTDGRVMLLSGVTPDPGGTAGDLLEMVLLGGGHRTLDELTALAARAGLTVAATAHRSGRFVVELSGRNWKAFGG
jgi:SAM-dependent methyltransferase